MPKDTKEMYWDYNKHIYILNVEYLKNNLGLDFIEKEGSLTRAKDKMYQISRQMFNFILGHQVFNRRYLEYLIAFDSALRPIMQEVLEWQARFEYDSNVTDLKKA